MNTKENKRRQFTKLNFPDWDEVIHSYLNEMKPASNDSNITEYVKVFFDKIEEIRNIGFGNHIAQTMQIALTASALSKPEADEKAIARKILNVLGEFNQFHSIFELNSGNFIYVDENIENIIGIPASDFTISNLFALNTNVQLYNSDDVAHVIRWALIAY
jgi:hypothetical protein